jgi:superfamily II DNA helicase RecQ
MIWGSTGFRKDFLRIGDMRVFMPDPANAPMCAATATCSSTVKDAIVQCLHLTQDFEYINLGNWRPNLSYGIYIMEGGRDSYSEITSFFTPRAEPIEDTPQALAFVEDYTTAHNVALALRRYFGLAGDNAHEFIAIYHSLLDDLTKADIVRRFKAGTIRIMVSTEALTMVSTSYILST